MDYWGEFPVCRRHHGFASLGTVGFKLLYPKACVIIPVRKVAQCLSGTYVGVGIGWAQLVALQHLVMPALVLLVC